MGLYNCLQWLNMYKAQIEPNLTFAAESYFDCQLDLQNQMMAV